MIFRINSESGRATGTIDRALTTEERIAKVAFERLPEGVSTGERCTMCCAMSMLPW